MREGQQRADRDQLAEHVDRQQRGHRIAPATPHRMVVNTGVLKRGLTRLKIGGSMPSADIRIRMRVWP